MKCDKIFIDYEDYPVLEDEFTLSAFMGTYSNKITNCNIDFITTDDTLRSKIKLIALAFGVPIYNEYHTDSLAYLDTDTFMDRMINSIMRKVNRWYIQKKIEEDLISNATLEKFISNGGTHSKTGETGTTGSAVIQKSASTPTGIEHNAQSETLDIELSHSDETDVTSMEVTDDYQDKYTNFVGKTNGVHRNEVDRDTDITRTSNYGLSLEILEKIPYSYINDVLKEVSQHFIQIY